MWHVIANIDTAFDSMQDCLSAYGVETGEFPVFTPRIPATRAPSENAETPRLSVCRELRDCFTGIGLLGRFRRCLAANEDAKSYVESGGEVYPVLVCQFDDGLPVRAPIKEEVWDVERTHELWLLQPARPEEIRLRWLTPYSILWKEGDCYACESVKFATEAEVAHGIHPWLTGTGNILESSLMDHDWEQSQYRKPWSKDEIALIKGMLSIEGIQTQLFPYRSKREIRELMKKEFDF